MFGLLRRESRSLKYLGYVVGLAPFSVCVQNDGQSYRIVFSHVMVLTKATFQKNLSRAQERKDGRGQECHKEPEESEGGFPGERCQWVWREK